MCFRFWESPEPDLRQVQFYVERLLSCFESALKERLKSIKQLDFPVAIFRFLFNNKGVDMKRGYKSLEKKDFESLWFAGNWYSAFINKRGTKRAIRFPVAIRSFLSKSPKLFSKCTFGKLEIKKQRIVQRISLTVFKETFYS